jgi:hypothetical protein
VTADQPEATGVKGFLGLLIEQVRDLARLYATAARQEVEAGLNDIKVALIFFGVTIGLLAAGAVVLIILVVFAISAATGIPPWATALFILFVLVGLAILLAFLGYRRVKDVSLMPDQTIAAAKEDLEWAQHLTRRG